MYLVSGHNEVQTETSLENYDVLYENLLIMI